MNKEDILKVLEKLRQTEKRNFDQTFDFIINLKEFDIKRESINTSVILPYPSKEIKVCAFLEKSTNLFDKVIIKTDFDKIDPKKIKAVVRDYDYCIASAKIMPELAKRFGKVLGPTGKMPDPKMGCVIMTETNEVMDALSKRLKKLAKIRAKDNSIKVVVGKESMKDENIAENCVAIFNTAVIAFPKKLDNIKNIMLKLTMSKPIKVLQKKDI